MRILVVDDEPSIRDLLTMALRFQDYEVDTAENGQEAIAKVASFSPQLIVLDVMLPDINGFDLARRLGGASQRVPILFLTARDEMQNKVIGLGLGDDYLTKPFSLEELIARIKAVLRRFEASEEETALSFGDLEMDDSTHEVRRGKDLIELTATEYRLLRYLMLNPRIVLSRQQLLDYVWEYDFGGDARVLETYISYLRKKLGSPDLIKTVRGVGYALREPA